MTNEELATPPTALEVAETLHDFDCYGCLTGLKAYQKHMEVLRRLAFDRDRLQDQENRFVTALRQLPQSIVDDIVDKMASDGLRNSYE